MNSNISGPSRIHSLDALRGAAALAVVVWHWQHFWAIGHSQRSFEHHLQPQYELFRIFYDQGWLAVDLFFTLSGFIFFWLYKDGISSRQIAPARFFILRFSRLYPLHIATLLFVAVGQIIYIAVNGEGFVYGNTDASHFLLNVFIASSLGFEKAHSFNGPIWSVSVEVLLYAIFFALCRINLARPAILLIIAAIGFSPLHMIYTPIGRGVGSFFLGAFTYEVYKYLDARPDSRSISICAACLAIVLWVAAVAHVYFGATLRELPIFWRVSDIFPHRGFAEVVLFPMTILSLALFESKFVVKVPGLQFLGSISYSSYLLHFPLQLLFALLLPAFGVTSAFFYTTLSFLMFFAILLTISAASFNYLEMPAQQYIRRRWLAPRACTSPPVPQKLNR